MSKYIIDTDKHMSPFDGIVMTTLGRLEDADRALEDAYQKGLEEGKKAFDLLESERNSEYQRGLNDAWECARELYLNGACKDMFGEYFNTFIKNHTASEAIAKLKAYEEKQSDKIEVGDEVRRKSAPENERGGIVTKDWENSYFIMWTDGSSGRWDKDKVVKTGRHFDIEKILEDMCK